MKTPLAISLAFLLVVELATLSRSALLGLACGALVLALPYRRHLRRPAFLVPLAAVAVLVATVVVVRLDFFLTVLRARTNTSRGAASPHFAVYSFVPDILSTHPFLGLGLNNFAVYYEFVTGRPDFGPHSFYVATIVETGIVGCALFAVFVVWIFRQLGAARRIGRALSAAGDPLAARVRPLAWGMTAALVATLVANVFYLTMTFYYFYVFATLAVALAGGGRRRAARMKVVVLTTSYPRGPDDVAGVFVRDAVRAAAVGGRRRRGRLARVVPALRARVRARHRRKSAAPALEGRSLLPAFLASYSLAARRAARERGSRSRALASVGPAGAEDPEAVRAPALGNGRRARARVPSGRREGSFGALASCSAPRRRSRRAHASSAHETCASSRAASRFPTRSASRTIHRTCSSSGGCPRRRAFSSFSRRPRASPRVIVGDGPLRDRVPDAVGFVPPRELGAYYERAAVVVCPSRREGYGVVAREAMAHGAPGGRDRGRRAPRCRRRRRDGPSSFPRVTRWRCGSAIERLLRDGELRSALGAAAREAARERFSLKAAAEATIGAYRDALT